MIIQSIAEICGREIDNKTAAAALAKEIMQLINDHFKVECDCEEIQVVTEDEMIRDYVSREGDCVPDEIIELKTDDDNCRIYKVTVKEFTAKWQVTPPDFWYVCTTNMMNLYRNDTIIPEPWLNDGQDEELVADYIKSFHIGICVRLHMKEEESYGETN